MNTGICGTCFLTGFAREPESIAVAQIEGCRLHGLRENSMKAAAMKGTGFSPYIRTRKIDAGFSPRGTE
jgi:hypothetical protein